MKKNIFIKGLSAVMIAALASGAVSCKDDYLDLEPLSSIATSTITSNTDAASKAYYGLIEAMFTQYSSWTDSNPRIAMLNGEALLYCYLGEGFGSDMFYYYWPFMGCNSYICHWTGMNLDSYIFTAAGWIYPYTLIEQANAILFGIDNAEGDESIRDYIKGGTLAIRAHAYFRLLQTYGPRFEDNNGGQERTVVLRTTTSTENLPLSTWNEVMAQIYKDLDEAIELLDNCGYERSSAEKWEVSADVARGIYARAAMLNHDWAKAQQMAKAARQNYPIMTAEEYQSGFVFANQEYMWTNILVYGDVSYVYYYSHGSFYACNGSYPCKWGVIGAGSINYDLYRKIPEGDIRAELFFTPDKDLVKPMKPESFWNKSVCDPATMDLNNMTRQMRQSITNFSKKRQPAGITLAAYTDHNTEKDDNFSMLVPFGAQYKFWAVDDFGANQFPFMRAAEMLLTEAEAACENGDYTTARNCLTELNAKRNPTYTLPASDGDLLEEVRLQRRIELWGEGFNWFDLKRWNVDMVRRAWVEGDPDSNNIPVSYSEKKVPTDNRGWRFTVPRNETMHNPLAK